MDSSQETISRLKFIGKINKGEKINTRHIYTQPYGIVTSISRMFLYQDNRGNTLNFCHTTITRSFELLISFDLSTKNSDKILYINLLKDLLQSIIGLVNLKYTYITDTKLCCDLDTLLECIKSNKHIIAYNKEEQDDINTTIKPETKLETKLETKPETKPETKLETKLETKPETKLETKLETKPETKPK